MNSPQKRIESRKNWKPFGKALTGGSCTTISNEEIFIEKPGSEPKLQPMKLQQKIVSESTKESIKEPTKERYIPPGKRTSRTSRTEGKNDDSTLFVSNISENTSENDLRDLFKYFGKIKSLRYLFNKGIAFISYYDQNASVEAIKRLKGYGYDHLILSVSYSNSDHK